MNTKRFGNLGFKIRNFIVDICPYFSDSNIAERKVKFKAIFDYSPKQSSSLVKEKVPKKMIGKLNKPVEPTRRSGRAGPKVDYRELEDYRKHKIGVHSALSQKVDVVDLNGISVKNPPDVDKDILENSTFVCSKCSRSFKFHNSLVKHVMADHENMEFRCDVCNKVYNYKANLKRHIDVSHGKSKVKFQCCLCSKSFLYRSTLKKHIKNHHV